MANNGRLYDFKNDDKDNLKDKDYDCSNLANHMSSEVICLVGPRSCGKSFTINNLIINQYPEFTRICVLACDIQSLEYPHAENYDSVKDIFDIVVENFNKKEKLAVIFEDLNYKRMNSKDKEMIDKIARFYVSHSKLTCYISTHTFYNVDANMRRKISIYYIFHGLNNELLQLIRRELGIIDKDDWSYITKKYLQKKRDNICICMTGHKVKLRYNVLNEIQY